MANLKPTPETVARFRKDMAGPEFPSKALPLLPRSIEWDLWRLPNEPTWAEMVKWDHALRRR